MNFKKTKILFIVTLLLIGFVSEVFPNITVNTVTSYVVENQAILPNRGYTPWRNVVGRNAEQEGYVIIFGLNIASNSGQKLTSVTVSQLGELSIDSTVITNRSGTILGVVPGFGTINVNLDIPPDDLGGNAGNDFFIGIRTTDDCMDRTFGIFIIYPVSGVTVNPSETNDIRTTGGQTQGITCELSIADIMPEPFDNVHSLPEFLRYPLYYQWQPGEMIRPRYDWTPFDYQYSPYPDIFYVPQVVPWETLTPVIAINCAHRNGVVRGFPMVFSEPEALSSITLTIKDTGNNNFDPSRSFRNTSIDLADINNPLLFPGITLWYDANQNGIWEPTDTLLRYQMSGFSPTGNPREWTVTLSPSPFSLPAQLETTFDSNYDFFVVIQVASDDGYPTLATIGGDYKIWIQPGGVQFGPYNKPFQYAGIREDQVKVIYNNVYIKDISPSRVDTIDPVEPFDLTTNVIPIIGINLAGGPQNYFPSEQILGIRVELLAYENINPNNDIAPLMESAFSGLSLWRDNKNDDPMSIGGFNLFDTLVPCKFSSFDINGPFDYQWAYDGYDVNTGSHKYHTYMVPTGSLQDNGWIYSDDLTITETNIRSGFDFFICFRTNNTLSYGSKFGFQVPINGIQLTGAKYAISAQQAITQQITSNVYAKILPLVISGASITPGSQPTPVMRIELDDNLSDKNPVLTGLTVEFYNHGGFTLNDIAGFAPVNPVFDFNTGWYNVTNFNVDNLKQCGLVIYKGTSVGIDWNQPILIKRYKYATSTWFDTPPGYVLEFQNPVAIPEILYVVIRTSSTMSPGDSFSCGLVGWGIGKQYLDSHGNLKPDWELWASRAFSIADANNIASNIFVRKRTEAFNYTLAGTIDIYATPGFDGITLNWVNNTNISETEFIKYEIWRTDSIHGETDITVIPVPGGWSASSYFDIATREGVGGLIDGVTYTYRLVMTYNRQGTEFTIESNRVSSKIYGFPSSMTPSRPTAVASTDGIAIWFMDNSSKSPPYQATSWLIQRKIVGQDFFTDVTTVDTVLTFYNPYIDTSAELNVVYQYRVIARREVTIPGVSGTFYAESYPSKLSDPAGIYGNDSGTFPIYAPSGGGGGCFIATAVFGSPLAKEIYILREFRDRILMKFQAGRKFVCWYYMYGPIGAKYINQHPFLKFPIRILLYPLVGFAWIVLHKFFLYFASIGILAIIFTLKIQKHNESPPYKGEGRIKGGG